MGQNQSMGSKQLGLPRLVPPTGSSAPGSASHRASSGQDRAPSANSPRPASNGSTQQAMDIQTQSVRAAIDNYIENCLAATPPDDEDPPSPLPHRPASAKTAKDIEVITVPEEDGNDTKNSSETDQAKPVESGGNKASQEASAAPAENSMDTAAEKSSSALAASAPSSGESASPKDKSVTVDTAPAEAARPPSIQSREDVPSTAEPPASAASDLAKASPSQANDDASNSELGQDVSKGKSSNESVGDGVTSVRLKTIIDRVLDNSLGVGAELKQIPVDQRILPQITAQGETSSDAGKHPETDGEKVREGESSKAASEGSADKKVEPMAVCFMDHIVKAVERSFSSITEEEEQKEKALASRAAESKNAAWNPRTSKASDPPSSTPSGTDGTISVQDIVDRVISQTEVISKLMTTSVPSSQTDSKPLVAASGTFYPDRAPAEASSHHGQQRRENHKDDTVRETTGRRGRPRMRSPYMDHRDPGQDQHHSSAAREAMANRRATGGGAGGGGGGGGPHEDYLHSMQAAMAKYGQVHHTHGIPPFLPGGIATTATVTQPYLPVGQVHSVMAAAAAAGLHSSAAALHQAQVARGHHASTTCQPPPLLRVNPMERGERPTQPQKHSHPHPPSRSCTCQACTVYFARERDAERVRIMQQQQQAGQGERSMPRMSPHSPHHPYPKASTSAASSHSQRWPGADPRHPDPKDKAHPHHPYPSYPQAAGRGPEVYPAGHPAYGIQTGVPVPQAAYADKQAAEPRHQDPHYPKQSDREYPQRQVHPGYEKGEVGGGRHPYPPSMASVKPVPGHAPHPSQHPTTLPHAHPHPSGPKPDDPVLDLTYRRDMMAPAPSSFGEEEKPLDLSAKKRSSPATFCERQDARHRAEDGRQFGGGNSGMHMDPHGRSPLAAQDRRREGDRFTSGSQHLHNLETSVESYFQKLQQHPAMHRGAPPPNISAGVPPHNISAGVPPHGITAGAPPHNISAGVPPHNIRAGIPPQNISTCVPPQNISAGVPPQQMNAGGGSAVGGHTGPVPLPPHHPTHHAQHRSPVNHQGYTTSSQPNHAYPAEPLLSPGGRRPQLHPIPAPNLSTSLGATAGRASAGFQCRNGVATVPMAPGVPTHSMPSVNAASNAPAAAPASSPQPLSSGHSAPYGSDSIRPRSVSPTGGSEVRGEDRRRGSVSKHEPLQNILGNNNPQDILYLICRLCRQTYGSPYGFRKHFRNQHGFEPKAEHTLVQTISATKNARQMTERGTPILDVETPGHEPYLHPGNPSSADSLGHAGHVPSPRMEMVRSVADESPQSRSSDSPGELLSGEGGASQASGYKYRNSFSRNSTDSKGRSPSGSASGGSVADEREDTKCLECPECGQTFQLNDFGSYKRHCRQHGQMRGVGGAGSQGVYTCTDCQCSFPEAQLLQEHLVRHQAHTATVLCTICRLPFPSPAHCQEHMRTAHNGSSSSSGEPTSSSPSPLTVDTKPKSTASVFSHSDISSTTSVKHETASAASADSSVSSFNLTVTTPSDLEIRRLPADHHVTSASPDSSSDNKKSQECSPVSSSEQNKAEVKTESVSLDSPKPTTADRADTPKPERTDSPKVKTETKVSVKTEDDKDSGFLDGCPSNDSRSMSTEDSLASPMDMEESTDLFMYKHKKFSAHRKRAGSSEASASDPKQPKVEPETRSVEQTQQNIVSSASDKSQSKKTGEEKGVAAAKSVPSKTEARHQMPFVWDRVTRSQAGKNARTTDYS